MIKIEIIRAMNLDHENKIFARAVAKWKTTKYNMQLLKETKEK